MSKRGDWVPCRSYGSNLGVAAPPLDQHIILVQHGELPFGTDAPLGVMDETTELVVERVVGQFDIWSESGVGLFALRIRVALYDDSDDTVAFYADDLFQGPDANEPFLWQRYIRQTSIHLLDPVFNMGWGTIDCRVSRRLKRDQCLVLSVSASSQDGIILPFLRSWVRPG